MPAKVIKNKTLTQKIITLKRQPVTIVLLVGLIFTLLNVTAIDRIRPYSSDDVAWQTTLLSWNPLNGHTAFFGSDPFIIKVPFYMLLNALFEPARGLLFATSILFIAINFLLFYWALLYFYRLLKIKLSYFTLLPVLWLSSMGLWFSPLFLNPNLRNFELGLTFVMFMFASKYYLGELKKRGGYVTNFLVVIACLLIGALIVNDLYFLYFGVLPLLFFTSLVAIPNHIKRMRAIKLAIFLLASIVVAKIIKIIMIRIGIDLVESANDSFIALRQLPRKIGGTIESVQMIFNADFWGRPISSLFTLGLLINAVLIACILLAVWHELRQLRSSGGKLSITPQRAWALFFSSLFIFVLAVYTLTAATDGISTYRYLVILPFIGTLLLAIFVADTYKTVRSLCVLVLSAAIVGNFILTLRAYQPELTKRHNPNQLQFDIIAGIKQKGLNRGYVEYWDGNINTYLSKGQITFLPVDCSTTSTIINKSWLVDGELQHPRAHQVTFLLLDPSRFDVGSCTDERIVAQFGEPVERFTLIGRRGYIFNYDIAVKFHL